MNIHRFSLAIILLLSSSLSFCQPRVTSVKDVDKLLKDRHLDFHVVYSNRPITETEGIVLNGDTLNVNLNYSGIGYSSFRIIDPSIKFISHNFKITAKEDTKKNQSITFSIKDNPDVSSIEMNILKNGLCTVIIHPIDASTVYYPGYIALK